MKDGFKDCIRNPVRCLAWGVAYPRRPGKIDYGFAWLFILAALASVITLIVILVR